MVLSPERGPRRPLLIRFALGGIHSRQIAWRYVWISAGLVLLAVVIGDPALIGIALIGVLAFGSSIWWMDRHDGWDDGAPAAAATSAGAASAASEGARSVASTTADAPPAPTPMPGEPMAAGEPGVAAADGPIPAAASVAALTDLAPGLVERLTSGDTSPSRSAAVLAATSAVVYVAALVNLEASGPMPTGGHLVAVVIDLLFGIVFGGAATYIALRRPRIPFERAATVLASTGLALLASLGFYVGGGDAAAGSEGVGLGPGVATIIFSFASAAAFWLTGRSGGMLGWLLAIPVLLIGWILGLEAWVAHVNSGG